jgi:hypothetical protein
LLASDDLSAADLIMLLKGVRGRNRADGSTRAVREGAICYLDEASKGK